MLSSLAKLLLTCTSIAPVGFVYAWAAGWQGNYYQAAAIGIVCLALVPICIRLMKYCQITLERFPISFESVEPADRENTAFLLLYLMPLFTDPVKDLNWLIWVPVLVIFSMMTITGYNYHFNPLLSLLRWHFYRVESNGVTYVLLTRRHLRSVSGAAYACQLTEYILLDTEG